MVKMQLSLAPYGLAAKPAHAPVAPTNLRIVNLPDRRG